MSKFNFTLPTSPLGCSWTPKVQFPKQETVVVTPYKPMKKEEADRIEQERKASLDAKELQEFTERYKNAIEKIKKLEANNEQFLSYNVEEFSIKDKNITGFHQDCGDGRPWHTSIVTSDSICYEAFADGGNKTAPSGQIRINGCDAIIVDSNNNGHVDKGDNVFFNVWPDMCEYNITVEDLLSGKMPQKDPNFPSEFHQ